MKKDAQKLMRIRYKRALKADPAIKFEDFNFAANLVMSRQLLDEFPDASLTPSWLLKSSKCHKLAPIYDVWNHETVPNSHYFNPVGGSLTIYAAREIKEDEELFVTYGPHTHQNLMLIAIYGMALESAKGEILFFSDNEIAQVLPSFDPEDNFAKSTLNEKPSEDYLKASCEVNMARFRTADPDHFFIRGKT
jgi:hypothetical protein